MISFFREDPIGSSIFALIVGAVIFFTIDFVASRPEVFSGTIVDKQYKSERTQVGTGITSDGKTITTVSSEPEEFMVMVKTKSGTITTADCDAILYYDKEIGDSIVCNAYQGLFTGWTYSVYGLE